MNNLRRKVENVMNGHLRMAESYSAQEKQLSMWCAAAQVCEAMADSHRTAAELLKQILDEESETQ